MLRLFSFLCFLVHSISAEEVSPLERLKQDAAGQSKYLSSGGDEAKKNLKADLAGFRSKIEPILKKSCVECHGPEKQKGKFRVDTLDPDLSHGEDADWWLEVMGVLTNGEMPPPDEDVELSDANRTEVIDWLASEIQTASRVHRAEQEQSSFRRMTRYEYNYALQDLLGLELDFAKGLPPEPVSEDGFKNSSEMLRISSSQYADYLKLNREALNRATVRGERPEMLYWGVSAERASERRIQGSRGRGRKGGGRGAHYKNTETGQTVPASWEFRRAKHAWAPEETRPKVPEPSEHIAVLPVGERLVVELGNRLPDEGILRVRVRAWRVFGEADQIPSLALDFGWQGNNNSKRVL